MEVEFKQREDTYLSELRYDKPKEVFKFILQRLQNGDSNYFQFLDVGCATGELIYFLRSHLATAHFTGIDNQPQFIELARCHSALQDCCFIEEDILLFSQGEFDCTLCLGMLGIYDDFEPLMDKLIEITRTKIFVQALFNPFNIDVRGIYRDNLNNKDWNRGFNIFARDRVADYLIDKKVKHFEFHALNLSVDIPHRPNMPHRSWTITDSAGSRHLTNGLCMLLPDTVLEIELST